MNMYIAHNTLTGIGHVLPHDIDVTNGLRIKTIISAFAHKCVNLLGINAANIPM